MQIAIGFRSRSASTWMKFSCVKDNFEKALIFAERFTGKNITLPILANVLLEANGNSLTLTATNLEFGIQISFPGKVIRSGRVSLPAKILSPLIQSIKEEKIDVEEKQGNVFIKASARDIRINGVAADDFPLLPKIKKTAFFSVDGGLLRSALEKTLPAVSPSEFKPELSGIFFKTSGTKLHLASTDTFRLAEVKIDLSQKPENETIFFILPSRVGQEVTRASEEMNEDVKFSLGENQALIESGRIKIVTRLIDGTFPEYAAVIPKNFETTAYLNREELLEAVRSSSIFASKLQDVMFHFKKNILRISSANPEVGEYKTEIPAAANGKELEVSFNYRYLLDGINALEDKECFIGLSGSASPALLQNKSDNSFLYVIMPIRTA